LIAASTIAVQADIEIARNYLRELADCDALWKKLTPAVAEAAESEAAHFRLMLRWLLAIGLTADLLTAWAAPEQPIQDVL
jgi:hypothetical protein